MFRLITIALTVLVTPFLGAADATTATSTTVVATVDPVAASPWASARGTDQYGTWADLTVKGVVQRFRLIPAGSFTMGCPDTETKAVWEFWKEGKYPGEWTQIAAPQHPVTLSKPFWLADSSCTQGLWQAVMGTNPAYFHDDPQRPVEQVTWDNCQQILTAMNQLDARLSARLPTEAEWEYACRAGATTALPTGDIVILGRNCAPALDMQAWYSGNSGIDDKTTLSFDAEGWPEKQYNFDRAGTHPVKLKKPNAWGLYDMLGNVSQWCGDFYCDYPTGPLTDPMGPTTGTKRVKRGGSWTDTVFCRCAGRYWSPPTDQYIDIGFRICLPVQKGCSQR